MKSVKCRINVLLPFLGLLVLAQGCSHKQANTPYDYVSKGKPIPEGIFLKDVENLPADKRAAFVQSNSNSIQQFEMDPDRSKLRYLMSLLPKGTQ